MDTKVEVILNAAAQALGEAWGSEVTLYLQDPIRTEWGRHRVLVCNVDGPASAPDTVVVKAAAEPTGMIFNEWAALELLNRAGSVGRLIPSIHAGAVEEQLIVIEDIGAGPSLHRLLQTRRQWAIDALEESQQLLGAVHAATRGKREDLESIRDGLPPGPVPPVIQIEAMALLGELDEWDATLSVPVADDVEAAASALRVPDSFLCLTFHDACPVNRIMTPEGMRAVDLEMAGLRHPMLDGAYATISHLRCSARRMRRNDGTAIPLDVRRLATEAYRRVAIVGYPEYSDRNRFEHDLLAAAAVWMIEILRRMRPKVASDKPLGFFGLTACQRVLAALDAFVDLADAADQFPALTSWAAALSQSLRAEWPEVPALRFAAAFDEEG